MTEPQKSNINRDVSHIEKKIISGMEFMSIQDEEYREYEIVTRLADKSLVESVYRIDKPLWLFVRPSGTHMVLDSNGAMNYIPPFVALRWKNAADKTPANF